MLLTLTNNFLKWSNPPKSGFLQKSQEKSVLQMYMLALSAWVELAGFNQRGRKLLLIEKSYFQGDKDDYNQWWIVLGTSVFPTVLQNDW